MIEAKLQIWGGSLEHGRACYYIAVDNKSILLDCGINKNNKKLPEIDYQRLKKIDYIFLSHSHEDHSEGLIKLIEKGIVIKTFMTTETGRHLKEMYNKVLRKNTYNFEFIDKLVEPYQWLRLDETIQVCYGASGHMIGAIWFLLKIKNRLVFYSGDYNSESKIISINEPQKILKLKKIDLAIIDCALGIDKESYEKKLFKIYREINKTINKSGKVLLPCTKYSKIIEIIVLLRIKYPNLVFAIYKDIFDELLYYLKDNNSLKRLFLDKDRIYIINIYNELNKLEFDIGVTDVLYKVTKDYYNFLCDFVGDKLNKIILLTRQCNGEKEDILENLELLIKAKVVSYNIKSHQGVKGVNKLINNLSINKVVLCHGTKEKLSKAIHILSENGHNHVRLCEIKEEILF